MLRTCIQGRGRSVTRRPERNVSRWRRKKRPPREMVVWLL